MKKAEIFLRVFLHKILLVLCAIHTTFATGGIRNFGMACDNFPKNTLNCIDTIICIESVTIGDEKAKCPKVTNIIKENINCTQDLVESFVMKKCNGKKDCTVFRRDTDISPYCKRAFKFVQIVFHCVSSPSKCSTISSTTTTTTKASETKRSSSLQNVMTTRIVSSTKGFATSTPRTSPKNVKNQTSSSTSLTDAPITTARKTKNDTSKYSLFTSTAPPSHVKGIKLCAQKTGTSAATVSFATPESNDLPTNPTEGERNAGHTFLNNYSPRRTYLTVILVASMAILVQLGFTAPWT